ncbi:MAG TPA: hypothetical protein VIT88_02370 [Pyrinomonadaceae bacterium]
MNNKLLFFGLMLILLPNALANGQTTDTENQRFEVGVHFTTLQSTISDVLDFSGGCTSSPCELRIGSTKKMQHGLGGRIGYNMNNYLTFEAEMNIFPSASSFSRPPAFTGGQKIQGVFGAKAGKRWTKAGVFVKGRPGFLYSSKGDLEFRPATACITIFPDPAGCFDTTGKTSFALDVGGVLEVYPSSRTIMRFDVGDTLVFLSDRRITGDFIPVNGGAPLFVGSVRVPSETTHNLQISVGVGVRF